MTGGRFTQIGIDRTIRLEWLEKTAALVLAGNEAKTIKTTFQHDFTGAFLNFHDGRKLGAIINRMLCFKFQTKFNPGNSPF